jgi:Rieske Fe-S protein
MKTTRRAVLAGAGATGVALLAGCAVYGNEAANPPAAPGAGGDPSVGDEPSDGAELAQVSEVPVGGGTIRSDERVVITQPTAGTFACFSAVCTHQGCLVTDVSNGTINCACHGSRFNITDGSVAGGPAVRPLPPVPITVDGETIRRA